MRSLHVQKIKPALELANHFFSRFDFTLPPEEFLKKAPAVCAAVDEFKAELEREHLLQNDTLAKKEEQKKNAAKKTSR
jgi:hypothetical protein